MYIVSISAEMAPVAKAGGLADVIQGLSRELILQGNQVEIFILLYDCLKRGKIHDLKQLDQIFWTEWDGINIKTRLYQGWVDHIKVTFVDADDPKHFFNRGCLYGAPDDPDRFAFFTKACLDYLKATGKEPDIFHLHDWQASIGFPLIKFKYKTQGVFQKSRTLLTIHNLSYQGLYNPELIQRVGLSIDQLYNQQGLQDERYTEAINLLKGGIVFSDYITTVSPTYSQEILTPEYGEGLERLLLNNAYKIKGILNGLDYHFWNPENDPSIPHHFSAQEMSGKEKMKESLKEALHLDPSNRPICAVVSRLVPQKGIELIQRALFRTLEGGGQFVLLGTSSSQDITNQFLTIQNNLLANRHLSINIEYSEEMAHMIYGGADLVIVPSLFEPCGLSQIIALRYGAVPLVRKTGGLADTVKDVDLSDAPLNMRNGYSFDNPIASSLYGALDRALACWFDDKEKWKETVKRGMELDFSWKQSAREYMMVYQQLLRL